MTFSWTVCLYLETKKSRIPGGMGFAISNMDLSKAKLRPVSLTSDLKKAAESTDSFEKIAPVSKARISHDVSTYHMFEDTNLPNTVYFLCYISEPPISPCVFFVHLT